MAKPQSVLKALWRASVKCRQITVAGKASSVSETQEDKE
jgi:hypothetical protein